MTDIEKVVPLPHGRGYLVNDQTEVQRSDETPEGDALRKWFRAGGKPSPYEPPLEDSKLAGIKRVENLFRTDMRKLTQNASPEERDTWSAKEGAARLLIANHSDVDPMLQAEADLTGESVDDLAVSIVAKADAYRLAAGSISGRKRRDIQMIQSAATVEEVNTIVAAVVQQRIDEGV